VVLTRGEVDRLLAGMSSTFQLKAKLLYGTGLRLMECARLRVKDVGSFSLWSMRQAALCFQEYHRARARAGARRVRPLLAGVEQ
jgi:integrase